MQVWTAIYLKCIKKLYDKNTSVNLRQHLFKFHEQKHIQFF